MKKIFLLVLMFIGIEVVNAASQTVSPAGSGTITKNGAIYTATPNSGYTFVKWEIDCKSPYFGTMHKSSTSNPVDVASLFSWGYIESNINITAYFETAATYTITWKNWDGTTIKATTVTQGTTPTYTGSTPTRPADAQYEYVFSGWTPSITAATANKTYTATYTTLPKYTITFNANGGLIPTGGNMGHTPSGHTTTLSSDQTTGTVVVTTNKTYFQAMNNDCPSREGHTFEGWYTDPTSGEQVYDNTGSRVVGAYWNSEGKWIGTSNLSIYAHWTPLAYTISTSATNGTVTGGGTFDYGTNHQLTATPNECYQFTQWTDGNTNNPRTITVTGAATYTAEFEKIKYTIRTEADNVSQGSATVE